MGEHTGKQFLFATQKQGRDAHPERKGIGILSNEGEGSKSSTRQRHTLRERHTHSERESHTLRETHTLRERERETH